MQKKRLSGIETISAVIWVVVILLTGIALVIFGSIVRYDYLTMKNSPPKQAEAQASASPTEKIAEKVPETEKPWMGLPKAPARLPALPKGYSWEELLLNGLSEFSYKNYDEADLIVAYGALQTSNPVVEVIVGGDNFWLQPELQQKAAASPWAVRAVFRSSVLRRAAYAWAMPSIREAFRKMPAGQQGEYFRILEHAEGYLQAFDYAREAEYFDELSRGRCQNAEWRKVHGMEELPWWHESRNCLLLFTAFDPRGKESPYRKVEAFCFRRFNADGVGPQTQLYWVRRALADLRAAVK